jgi:predicted  nucleic acid-binding Zn-ribbon protein
LKQIELLPYVIDQEIVDYYRLVLNELKLLRQAKVGFLRTLKTYRIIKRNVIKDAREKPMHELEFRRLLKKVETAVERVTNDEYFKNIDININKWNRKKKSVESEIDSLVQFCN